MNNNLNNKNILSPKKDDKKDNIITSLKEVESFLNNLNCFCSSVKLANLLKKFR